MRSLNLTKPRSRTLGAAAATAAGIAGVVAGGLYGAGEINAPRRPWPDYRLTPFELGIDYDEVSFVAEDGVRLAGWWLDTPGSERVVIVSHGHRGNMADMLGIGPGLWRAGETVLLFDFRGNGDSDDGPQSLAHYEQRDLGAAIAFARSRRPHARIALVGFSMGSCVSLFAAAEDPEIVSVVADSPFADMHGVIANRIRQMRLPPFPVVGLTDHATRARYGYRFGEVQPIEAIGRIAPRPILILHGTGDRVIPVEHARRLQAAAGPSAQLRTFDGVEHCGAYFQDRAGYVDLVATFLRGDPLPGSA